jgi:hypothetical protein
VIVRFADQPTERAKGVNLTPDEWRVFARINGNDNIAAIVRLTGLSEFDVCRIIYGFIQAGLVEVVKPQITFAVAARPPELPTNGTAPLGVPVPAGATNGRATGPDAPAAHSAQGFVPPKRGLIYRLIERIRRM